MKARRASVKNVLITGRPGVGKSTLVSKLIEKARELKLKVGGLSTPEIRRSGRRLGFKLVDIATGEEGILAGVGIKGPRVSRYGVNLSDLDRIGVAAIKNALKHSDIVVIDEIGKMELFSNSFKRAVIEALNSSKPVIATIGKFLKDPFVSEILRREDVSLFEITLENRDLIFKEISRLIFKDLLGSDSSSTGRRN